MAVSVPRPHLTTSRHLPAATERPHTMPLPPIQQPFQFPDVPNTADQATMRKRAQPQVLTLPAIPAGVWIFQPTSSVAIIQPTSTEQPRNLACPPVVPRSTKCYRKRKSQESTEGKQKKVYKQRTGATICSQCHQERDQEHHTQFYGSWYCANTQTQPIEEWRTMMSTRRRAKMMKKKEKND